MSSRERETFDIIKKSLKPLKVPEGWAREEYVLFVLAEMGSKCPEAGDLFTFFRAQDAAIIGDMKQEIRDIRLQIERALQIQETWYAGMPTADKVFGKGEVAKATIGYLRAALEMRLQVS